MKKFGLVVGMLVLLSGSAMAGTITFKGTTTGGVSVDATMDITANGSNEVKVVLTNLISGQNTVGQAITGFTFKIGGNSITGLVSQAGQLIDITGKSTYSLVAGTPNQWHLDIDGTNPDFGVTILAGAGSPTNSIVSGNSPKWNNGMATSSAHEPYILNTATFYVKVGGNVNSDSVITDSQMFFNTTGQTIIRTPEPTSLLLLGSGLIGLFGLGLRRRNQ